MSDFQDSNGEDRYVQFLGYDFEYDPIYGVYGCLTEQAHLSNLRYMLQNIFTDDINQHILGEAKRLTLVYFNSAGVSFGSMRRIKNRLPKKCISGGDFKSEALKKIGQEYFYALKKIYYCHPGIWDMSIFPSLSLFDRMVDCFIETVPSFADLVYALGPLFYGNQIDERVKKAEKDSGWLQIFDIQEVKLAKKQL